MTRPYGMQHSGARPLFENGRMIVSELKGPLFVAAAYYLGAQAAFYVGTLSDKIFAPFWPPNVILFCALLMTPRSRWALYLALAFPAHVAAEVGVGMPAGQLIVAFATNCAVVLLNAVILRRLIEGPPWFPSFQKMSRYILVAAGIGPAVAALGGAFVRIMGDGSLDSYWSHWLEWYISNALGALTLGPVLLAWLSGTPVWPGWAVTARKLEATALAVLLAAVSMAGLHFSVGAAPHGLEPVFLYLPLPFIIWAAIRFGARGASGAILILAVVSIWCASRGTSPFAGGDPEKNVLALQLFLFGVSIPVLLLAAAVEQLRGAERMSRELMGVLLHAHDQEKRMLSRDLHDSTAQTLGAASLVAMRLQQDVPPSARPLLTQLDDLIQKSIRDLRKTSYLLYPPLLDESGLALALRAFVESTGIPVQMEFSSDTGNMPESAELVLFRLAQETLTSFHPEGDGKAVIRLSRRKKTGLGDCIVLAIDDAGMSRTEDFSFAGIRERLRQLGGSLEIERWSRRTIISAIIPAR